ncbi:MAG: hypothetical protein UX62_C0024G0005 [Microgenomates group bacterium GW2011_GWA2_46_7]|nr:MAG: hypothetical protein UX62_C0024G0005 [Microgenomates group bacterium GW2011_GWA2_46_7]KKU46341.1 MAG: hypothetical protein UX64_C0008G0004 [Microgenomates group bacterium GW2011_GWC2_46_7]
MRLWSTLGFGCLVVIFTGVVVVKALVWKNQCSQITEHFVEQCGDKIDKALPLIKWVSRIFPNTEIVESIPLYEELRFLREDWRYLGGYEQPISYLILLQNDTEMRANGGFFGSYAVALINQAKLELRFEDIYSPDGQLSGYVEPPKPIQTAFLKGGYYLRDSDWDPDFTQSARTIRWFLSKGGEINPDVMITISLSTIKKILEITGPIPIPDYDLALSSGNVYQKLQAKVETDFFPGSTQKKDILTGVGQSLMAHLEQLPLKRKLAVARILLRELQNQNILLNTNNGSLQNKFEKKNWAGGLTRPRCSGGELSCNLDTFMTIEANMGANKANCCTARRTTHQIKEQGDSIVHQVELTYTNASEEENPKLPDFFGGNYIQYIRFYLPKNSTNVEVEASPTNPTTLAYFPEPYTLGPNNLDIMDIDEFRVVGFFHHTRAGTSSFIQLKYELPNNGQKYELHLLKQHGMQNSPQEIVMGEQTVTTNLENDYLFRAN